MKIISRCLDALQCFHISLYCHVLYIDMSYTPIVSVKFDSRYRFNNFISIWAITNYEITS